VVTRAGDPSAPIHRIREQVQAAENAHDADALIALLADDAVLMVPDYPVQEGKAAAGRFTRALTEYFRDNLERRIAYISAEVMVLGDIAFDRGTFAFEVRETGEGAFERVTGKYFWLLRKTRGRWALSRIIVSRDEPEAAD
jgi:ketosteroid isomerase-like protein